MPKPVTTITLDVMGENPTLQELQNFINAAIDAGSDLDAIVDVDGNSLTVSND